jgi:hypothetical protein
MPATQAALENIYDEYAAVATVPLTIDWGRYSTKQNKGHGYEEKELPITPPHITTTTANNALLFPSPPKVVGRRGFGVQPSSSPLSREWSSSSSDSESEGSGLVRRSAMRRRNRDSTDSVESIWFGPVGFDVSPPRSNSRSPSKHDSRYSSDYESPLSGRDSSVLGGSVDTWISSTRSRIRILNHENSSTTTPSEIYVGPLYEVISFIWDTFSYPQNINSLKSAFSKYSLPRSNVINLVASSSMSFETFLKSTELQVNISPPQKPRYTSLETLEITLPADLVNALNTATRDSNKIKGMIRIIMIQQIGEYIHNHVLLQDGREILISPSIDLKRVKEMKGGELITSAMLGGSPTYRWHSGRMQILFRKEGVVYRVPERVMDDVFRNSLVQPFVIEELDL